MDRLMAMQVFVRVVESGSFSKAAREFATTQPTVTKMVAATEELSNRSGPTLGGFHDALRRLHRSGRVYLHPWTGPLYSLPDPSYALLVGHEVAYYASSQVKKPERLTAVLAEY